MNLLGPPPYHIQKDGVESEIDPIVEYVGTYMGTMLLTLITFWFIPNKELATLLIMPLGIFIFFPVSLVIVRTIWKWSFP